MDIKKKLLPFVNSTMIPLVDKIPLLRSLFSYVGKNVCADSYRDLRRKFIKNGEGSKWDVKLRTEIILRFEVVDAMVPSQTTPADGLMLAEALLSVGAEGAVVECGCFSGASTAKLSIISKITGRKLHVFDSFEGLPESATGDASDFSIQKAGEGTDWRPGSFAAGLERVRDNVEKYGEISVCSFYKGWFKDTLISENLPDKIAMAFTDVDLPESAKECLAAIWLTLAERGIYFTHDAAFIKVLLTVMDEKLWRDKLGEFPPILFGAGSGLAHSARHLGFAVKGKGLPAEYYKSLTIEK
ncbi:MAG: hypothetical protein CVT49_10755 [candidate division Zixibacteria bacterium HGW-Zixibacteria-1]|nr:MAG: hypothetical protein CVT49_10755 [candidate division Zixibacteria bacterium HGW-Zixibacteria-1]